MAKPAAEPTPADSGRRRVPYQGAEPAAPTPVAPASSPASPPAAGKDAGRDAGATEPLTKE